MGGLNWWEKAERGLQKFAGGNGGFTYQIQQLKDGMNPMRLIRVPIIRAVHFLRSWHTMMGTTGKGSINCGIQFNENAEWVGECPICAVLEALAKKDKEVYNRLWRMRVSRRALLVAIPLKQENGQILPADGDITEPVLYNVPLSVVVGSEGSSSIATYCKIHGDPTDPDNGWDIIVSRIRRGNNVSYSVIVPTAPRPLTEYERELWEEGRIWDLSGFQRPPTIEDFRDVLGEEFVKLAVELNVLDEDILKEPTPTVLREKMVSETQDDDNKETEEVAQKQSFSPPLLEEQSKNDTVGAVEKEEQTAKPKYPRCGDTPNPDNFDYEECVRAVCPNMAQCLMEWQKRTQTANEESERK